MANKNSNATSRTINDISGQKFGRWTAISPSSSRQWLCACECGITRDVLTHSLKAGKSKSCGCLRFRSRAIKDLSGLSFGRLTALSYAGDSKWHCVCECGKSSIVESCKLKVGHTRSCGCYRQEVITSSSVTHGHRIGYGATPEYKCWNGLIQRCHNPKNPGYENYGGRGLSVCDDWRQDFGRFLEDVGPRPGCSYSIERIDNQKGYFPGNCRWATRRDQNNNKRDNRLIAFQGEIKTLSQWAEQVKIPFDTIWSRITRYGWCSDCALTVPPIKSASQRSESCPHRP